MTQQQQHPITPPPELVQQWLEEADTFRFLVKQVHQYVATRAAQWGADQANADIESKLQKAVDQELEACCEWLGARTSLIFPVELRAARRPKSEKQQALEDLDALQADLANYGMGFKTTNIRRALESIPDPRSEEP